MMIKWYLMKCQLPIYKLLKLNIMNNYYIKCRISERQSVKLMTFTNGRFSWILICYSNGYCQLMSETDFDKGLCMAETISPENETLAEVRKEFESSRSNPMKI